MLPQGSTVVMHRARASFLLPPFSAPADALVVVSLLPLRLCAYTALSLLRLLYVEGTAYRWCVL